MSDDDSMEFLAPNNGKEREQTSEYFRCGMMKRNKTKKTSDLNQNT